MISVVKRGLDSEGRGRGAKRKINAKLKDGN